MKKQLCILFLLVAATGTLWPQEITTIHGSGFTDYTRVSLKVYSYPHLGYETLETKVLDKGGSFDFQTPFSEANLYELNFDEKEFVPLSITRGGTVHVMRKEGNTHIEGSESSRKIRDFQQQNAALQARYFGQLKADMDQAMQEEDQERIDLLMQEAENAIRQFLPEFRALVVSMGITPEGFYALQYTDFNKELAFVESRLAAFQQEAPGSIFTLSLEKLVYRATSTAIGQRPPDFSAVDSKGNEVRLDQFKGKVLFIDFWANWCRACRVENPQFARLYEVHKDQGFHVLSISQDVKQEHWKNAIQMDGIEAFQHVLDTGNVISELYSISSLPQNLLLDKDGIIVAKNLNAAQLEGILADW